MTRVDAKGREIAPFAFVSKTPDSRRIKTQKKCFITHPLIRQKQFISHRRNISHYLFDERLWQTEISKSLKILIETYEF